jgi:hypothetical protein
METGDTAGRLLPWAFAQEKSSQPAEEFSDGPCCTSRPGVSRHHQSASQGLNKFAGKIEKVTINLKRSELSHAYGEVTDTATQEISHEVGRTRGKQQRRRPPPNQ